MNGYSENFKELSEFYKKARSVKFVFLRQLMIVSATLFAVLVAVPHSVSSDKHLLILYKMALMLIPIGILFLAIALYEEISLANFLKKIYYKELKKQIDQGEKMNNQVLPGGASPKLFQFSEKLAYLSLFLSLIALSVYAVFS